MLVSGSLYSSFQSRLWELQDRSVVYNVLHWIGDIQTPQTNANVFTVEVGIGPQSMRAMPGVGAYNNQQQQLSQSRSSSTAGRVPNNKMGMDVFKR